MSHNRYQLPFICDEDLFLHVKKTVEKYRFSTDIKSFTHNLIDPIKLTFDSHIYQLNPDTVIKNEILRQIDKSNTNHIGYFHQNIFPYFDSSWQIPEKGFDLIHREKHIYVEIKNKHNTMNSASSQKIYKSMQNTILQDDQATCYLVEVISRKSQDTAWVISLDGMQHRHNRIRRISIDQFYALVTGYPHAFHALCQQIPPVLQDVLQSEQSEHKFLTAELNQSINIKDLYHLSFRHYLGFERDLFQGDLL
ncbi:Eco47II family restriction endonuclease [Entomospira nematocerorum]|uniref:Eco47II family restriction endonuclease n=1 Tax=Entomospira nematocerorum TaxID=2719987 RepID=A0A968GE90_9SPIO|nr:Eco47II family restriction endonuclease [Entomospira nematocera]NIZ47457.1 Eco47II family restriction endonuclease [Entomospira nematocera]WDI34004.1 Eco47II family restriction endonuclease [Entomospira nematocera]